MIQLKRHHSLLIIAGVLVGVIALLAVANLWFLQKFHGRNLHDSAAQSVLGLGSDLARKLANHPVIRAGGDEPGQWAEFSRLVHALKGFEPSLLYVTVNEADVTVFHQDTSYTNAEPGLPVIDSGVRIGRKLLTTPAGDFPVITFSAQVPNEAGAQRRVQIAMRKEAVQQREAQAARILAIMFRLSLITLSVSLSLAVVLVVWVVRHELERDRRRRDEEHLAFAGLLADGIIHDVRNPMSSLRLDVQMLEKEAAKGPECRVGRITELALRARTTMDRMDMVMREFLYVSKPDARQPETFEINGCIKDCLDLLAPRFEREKVLLEPELCGDPLVMRGYSVGMKRAILNLLTNAKQASSPGKRVWIRLKRAGTEAIIIVEDEGPGLGPEGGAHLFEMFVSGRPDGMGLGLYLAKAAVENNRGTILAGNREGGGARFQIILPLLVL